MLSFSQRVQVDAALVIDVLRETEGLTVRVITELSGVPDQRTRFALAYLLGAEKVHDDGVLAGTKGGARVWLAAPSLPFANTKAPA